MKKWILSLLIGASVLVVVSVFMVLSSGEKPDYVFHDIFIYGSLNVSLGEKVYVIYDGDVSPSELNAVIARNVPNLVFSLTRKGYNVSTIALSFDSGSGRYVDCVSYENYTLEECLGLLNTSSVIWFRYPTGEKNPRIVLCDNDIIVYPRNATDYEETILFVNEFVSGNFRPANH